MIGVRDEHVRVREHDAGELSHYSSRTIDFEYDFPGAMGWKELYGLANRTDFDLRQHQEFSGEDLHYFDQAENRIHPARDRADVRRRPHLPDSCSSTPTTRRRRSTSTAKPDTRVVLRLHPRVAPYKAAVLPLMKKPELAAAELESVRDVERQTWRAGRLRRDRQHRQALPAARTRSARRSASRSISRRSRTAA